MFDEEMCTWVNQSWCPDRGACQSRKFIDIWGVLFSLVAGQDLCCFIFKWKDAHIGIPSFPAVDGPAGSNEATGPLCWLPGIECWEPWPILLSISLVQTGPLKDATGSPSMSLSLQISSPARQLLKHTWQTLGDCHPESHRFGTKWGSKSPKEFPD